MDIGNCKLVQLLGKVSDVRLRFYFKNYFCWLGIKGFGNESKELVTAANKSFCRDK